MADHKSFLIYKDNEPLINECSNEQIGEIFRALFAFACRGEECTSDDPLVRACYAVFRNAIERDDEKYQARCLVNSMNGAKGGRPKKVDVKVEVKSKKKRKKDK